MWEEYVLLSAGAHGYQMVSDPLGAGAIGSCESAYMVLETELGSSVGAVYSANH